MIFAWLRRLVPAVLVVACVACGGGSGDEAEDSPSATSETTTTTGPPASEPGVPAGAGEAGGASGDTTAPTDSTQPQGGGGEPSATTAPAPPQPTGPQPAQPGTYRFAQSGGVTSPLPIKAPPEGTLVVDASAADGTQVSHRRTDPSQPPSDTVIRFGPDGMFITAVTMRAQGQQIACSFGSGVPAPPWPPSVGAPISGQATCDQGSASVSGSITGTSTATVGGTPVDVFVVDTTISVTGSNLSATVQVNAWFAPSLRLIVHDHTVISGTYYGAQFISDTTSDLISATPS